MSWIALSLSCLALIAMAERGRSTATLAKLPREYIFFVPWSVQIVNRRIKFISSIIKNSAIYNVHVGSQTELVSSRVYSVFSFLHMEQPYSTAYPLTSRIREPLTHSIRSNSHVCPRLALFRAMARQSEHWILARLCMHVYTKVTLALWRVV